MLDRGLTEDGAAQALGWPKTRVTARVKILELPERAQQLIGEGVIALAAVDQLRAIGTVAPPLLDAVIAYLDDGNAWAAERLTREPGWVLDAAMSHTGGKTFAAYLHSAGAHEIAELRLGKKTEELHAQAEKLHRQLDRYAYGLPPVRFTDADIDQARTAGVLIEFERGRAIIVDRSLYRELVKAAIKRTHDELEAKAAATAKETKTARSTKQPTDPVTVAKRERDCQQRELTDQAHGANSDLGVSLMHNLAAVSPDDIDVARFFALCGHPHKTNYAERVTMPTRSRAAAWRRARMDCSASRAAGGVGIVPARSATSEGHSSPASRERGGDGVSAPPRPERASVLRSPRRLLIAREAGGRTCPPGA